MKLEEGLYCGFHTRCHNKPVVLQRWVKGNGPSGRNHIAWYCREGMGGAHPSVWIVQQMAGKPQTWELILLEPVSTEPIKELIFGSSDKKVD